MPTYSPPLAYWYLRKKRRHVVDLASIGPGSYVPTPTPPGNNPGGTNADANATLSTNFTLGLPGLGN